VSVWAMLLMMAKLLRMMMVKNDKSRIRMSGFVCLSPWVAELRVMPKR
jgi:hypothetical protein